jgi:hypothetical protein
MCSFLGEYVTSSAAMMSGRLGHTMVVLTAHPSGVSVMQAVHATRTWLPPWVGYNAGHTVDCTS